MFFSLSWIVPFWGLPDDYAGTYFRERDKVHGVVAIDPRLHRAGIEFPQVRHRERRGVERHRSWKREDVDRSGFERVFVDDLHPGEGDHRAGVGHMEYMAIKTVKRSTIHGKAGGSICSITWLWLIDHYSVIKCSISI